MGTGKKFNKDKIFIKIEHAATDGVVGEIEYEVLGEVKLSIATTFTSSGTLTVQGRIKHSSTWQTIGTLTAGGDFDTFDIDAYDYVRFNFTVAAGSTGEIAASGFFKASSSASVGVGAAFTTIQTDAGTSPVATGMDTLTITSTDGSITVSGNSTTDTIDLSGNLGNVVGSASSIDNEIVRFDSTTGKIIQAYTSGGPTISDTGAISITNTISSIGTGLRSERFGISSVAGPDDSTACGYTATASGDESSALGASSSATVFAACAFGKGATASGQYGTAFGRNAAANATFSLALGSAASATHQDSIAIGVQATTTAVNQLVIGGTSSQIDNAYIGKGVTHATPNAVNLSITSGLGTNITGANFTLSGSQGTGTGLGGHLVFRTAAAGASGSALNALTTHMEITDDGYIVFPTLPTSSAGLPTGAIWSNAGVITIV